jgi:hypothetical protein
MVRKLQGALLPKQGGQEDTGTAPLELGQSWGGKMTGGHDLAEPWPYQFQVFRGLLADEYGLCKTINVAEVRGN